MLERRLLLVTGKGGTGRSAVAASLAIAAARHGRRVLALALDDASGLAAHLGGVAATAVPRRWGDVHMARVDPASALDEYLRLRGRGRVPSAGSATGPRIPVPRLGPVSRLFAAVVETVPGVRDTVLIGKAVFESTRPRWDLVVVDCPPTGQVLSLLRAPATIAGLVPGGAVRQQARWLAERLGEEAHTGAVVVATPEELPVEEAREFLGAVTADRTIPVAAVVANRVLPAATWEAPPPGDDPIAAAARHHVALVTEQGRHLDDLSPDHRAPYLFGVRTPAECAARLADLWERR